MTAARQSSQTVRLSFTAPASNGRSITNYQYTYKTPTQNSGNYVAWADTNSTSTTIDISGLTNGLQYTFKVRAETLTTVYGADSNEPVATPYTNPSVTINSVTNFNQNVATCNATVSWGGSSTTVRFERSTNNSTWTDLGLAVGSPVTADNTNVYLNISDLSPGTLYYIRAKTVNSAETIYSLSTSFTTWSLKPAISSNGTADFVSTQNFSVPTVTPTGGSQITPSIYEIALVGGGGGCGAYSGGGGGQLKSYVSAVCSNSNGAITITVGGGGAGWEISTQNPGSGGASSITGTNSTLNAPGGSAGNKDTVSFPANNTIYTRNYDGGASADNVNIYLGGNLQYASYASGKSSIGYYGGGGGAGAGGHGSSGSVVVASPYSGSGGNGGASGSAYGLNGVGAGGAGWGSQASGTATSGYGAGGDAANPDQLVSQGEAGIGGAVRFKVYRA